MSCACQRGAQGPRTGEPGTCVEPPPLLQLVFRDPPPLERSAWHRVVDRVCVRAVLVPGPFEDKDQVADPGLDAASGDGGEARVEVGLDADDFSDVIRPARAGWNWRVWQGERRKKRRKSERDGPGSRDVSVATWIVSGCSRLSPTALANACLPFGFAGSAKLQREEEGERNASSASGRSRRSRQGTWAAATHCSFMQAEQILARKCTSPCRRSCADRTSTLCRTAGARTGGPSSGARVRGGGRARGRRPTGMRTTGP